MTVKGELNVIKKILNDVHSENRNCRKYFLKISIKAVKVTIPSSLKNSFMEIIIFLKHVTKLFLL